LCYHHMVGFCWLVVIVSCDLGLLTEALDTDGSVGLCRSNVNVGVVELPATSFTFFGTLYKPGVRIG